MPRRKTLYLLLFLFCGFTPLYAHIGDVLVPIYQLSDQEVAQIDLFDGSLDEWETTLGLPTLTPEDFTVTAVVGDMAPYDPRDLDYAIWLGWHHSSRLYMAVQRIDNVYIPPEDGADLRQLWRYDGIEFMIDADHSGGDFSGADCDWVCSAKDENNRTAQQYVAVADAGERHIGNLSFGSEWVTSPPFAQGGGTTIQRDLFETAIEFYVTPFDDLRYNQPDSSVVSPLFAQKIIGFQVAVPDFDRIPGEHYRSYSTLQGQPAVWRYADRFVDGLLVDRPATSVSPSTWARIKASLR